nr:reverse transcriptase domain-containing protein [Tanacetum cinerariifolium]
MRTRPSSNLHCESSPNPTSSNLKRRNRRRSKQPFILEESPVDAMADQHTMAELVSTPTEGYAEAIVVSPAWDRYKHLLRACPHHGFTELHQLDTFYNALNPADQDSINSVAGGNLLERRTQDVLTIIKNKSKVRNSRNNLIVSQVKSSDAKSSSSSEIAKLTHAVNQQTSVVTTAMTAILKQFQATSPPASVKVIGFFQMNTASTSGSGPLPSNTIANPKGELKAITTRSGIVLDGPSVSMPPLFINPKEDERVEETLELGASINLMPLSIWKKLGLPKLISTRMTLALANRAICTPAGIARDVFVPVGKFTFPADFVIVDYESDPRVPLILGRPFLRTARALIDVHGEEMILHDGDERLTLNMRHDTSSYSNQPQKESINIINIYDDSCEDFLKDLFATNHLSGNPTFSSQTNLTSPEVKNDIFDPEGDIVLIEKLINFDSTKDLPPPYNINPLRMDSILKDLVDEDNLAYLNDNLIDTMPEMFTDEHALDYSSPPLYDEYDDDLFEVYTDTEYVYDDPFDSKEDEIKESKLLIDELDPLRSSDFLPSPEYDLILF